MPLRRNREQELQRALETEHMSALTKHVRLRQPTALPPAGTVTEALYGRLTEADLAAIEAALEGTARDYWDPASPEERKRLALTFAAHYGIEDALLHTGLTDAQPPEDVHAMARGLLAAGGDPAIADLVVDILQTSGIPILEGSSVLDFGCSSGRVLRALAAYRPDLECIGCDPNPEAIGWAQEHLPMARFFVSPGTPPLELEADSIDVAFAISIWSHFDFTPALAWLEEMRRIVKPGGHLIVTTHGLDTLGDHLRGDAMSLDTAAHTVGSLLAYGFQYYDVFGEDGDWGVKDEGWGNAYVGLDWLAQVTTPNWAIRRFAPGALAANQDVTVLERRA